MEGKARMPTKHIRYRMVSDPEQGIIMYPSLLERERKTLHQSTSLDSEVQIFKQTPEYFAGLHLLDKTGFKVRLQTAQLERELFMTKDPDKTIDRWIENATVDMGSFIPEFVKQLPVLHLKLATVWVDGQKRIVAPGYHNASLLDSTSKSERDGATYEGIADMEKKLLEEPDGTIFFRTSPMGEEFSETQSQIFIKHSSNNIEAYTIRTKMETNENRQLLERIGVTISDSNQMPEEEKVKALTRLNAVVNPQMGLSSIRKILENMQEIAGTDHKGNSFANIFRLFDVYYTGNSSFQLSESAHANIVAFMNFARSRMKLYLERPDVYPLPLFIDDLQVGLGLSILHIQGNELAKISYDTQPIRNYYNDIQSDKYLMNAPIDYQESYKRLVVAGGCSNKSRDEESGINDNALFEKEEHSSSLFGPRQKKEKKREWHLGDCLDKPNGCGTKNVLVGECSLCQVCEDKYNKGEMGNFSMN